MSTANADEQPPSSAFTSPQPLSHIPILRSNASSAVVSPEPLGSIPISGSDAKSPSSNAQVQQAEETIRRPSFIAESISGLFLSNTPAASPVAASSDSSGSAADQPRGGARSRAGSLSGISGGLAMGLSGLTPSGSPVLTETAPGGTRSRSGSMSGVGGLAWAMGATGAAASAAASSGASTAAFSVPPSSMLLSVESPAATTTASTLAYPLGLSGLIHSGGLSSGRAASAASLALGVSPRGSVSSDENVPAAGLAASIAPSLATAAVSASAGPAASSSVRTARSWSLSLAASSASSASVGELPDVSSISHSQATGYTGRHSVGNAASVASASSEPPGLAASMRARLRGALRSTPSRSSEHKATEELQKEWSGIIARWNEYQLNGLAASSNLSASTLRDNQSRLTKLLLTHGIPSNLRPTVWMLLIGNTLGITPAQWRELKEESRRNRREYERWKRRVNNSNMGQAAAAAAAAAAASTQQHQSEQTSRSVTTASESSTDAPIGAVSPVSSPVAPLSPSTSSLPPHLSLFSLIDQDLPRTFPELKFFHVERQEQQSDGRGMDGEGGEGEHKEQQESEEGGYGDALKEVLECASLFRLKHASTLDGSPSNDPNSPPSSSTATVGYVQGMSFLASILLLSLGDDSFLVFLALANLLENPCERLSELFSMDAHATRGYLEQFQRQMGQSLPGLAQHFEQVGIQPDMYMFKWIFSVYSQSLQLDSCFRVWDCFLWESFRTRGQLIAPPTNMTIVQQGENGAAGTDGSGGPPATQRVSSTRSAISSALTSAREALASATSSTPVVMMNGIPAPGSGFTFLFRVALGILAMYTDVLRTAGFEECLYFLQHLPGKPSAASAARESMLDSGVEASSMDLEQLFACIREVKMDEKIWKDNTGRTARHVRAMYVPHQIISPRPSTQQQQQQQQQLHARADSKPDFSGYGSPTVSPNV